MNVIPHNVFYTPYDVFPHIYESEIYDTSNVLI